MKKFKLPRKKKKVWKKALQEITTNPTKGHSVSLWKQLSVGYDKRKSSDFTLDEFSKELYNFFNGPDRKLQFESDQKFMELINPYLHMTEAEMQIAVPDGAYEVSGNGLVAWTGKGGLILVILATQRELNKYKNI